MPPVALGRNLLAHRVGQRRVGEELLAQRVELVPPYALSAVSSRPRGEPAKHLVRAGVALVDSLVAVAHRCGGCDSGVLLDRLSGAARVVRGWSSSVVLSNMEHLPHRPAFCGGAASWTRSSSAHVRLVLRAAAPNLDPREVV